MKPYLLVGFFFLFTASVAFPYRSFSAPLPITRETMLSEFNRYREAHQLPAVTHDEALCQLAEVRVKEIRSDFTHQGFYKHEKSFRKAYPQFDTIGENLAMGFKTPEETIEAWVASPTHKANLDKAEYDSVCLSVETSGYLVYVVQILGEHRPAGQKYGPAN